MAETQQIRVSNGRIQRRYGGKWVSTSAKALRELATKGALFSYKSGRTTVSGERAISTALSDKNKLFGIPTSISPSQREAMNATRRTAGYVPSVPKGPGAGTTTEDGLDIPVGDEFADLFGEGGLGGTEASTSLQEAQIAAASQAAALAENQRQFNLGLEEKKRQRLAELYANPRRVFETAYEQGGLRPDSVIRAAQDAITPEELLPLFNQWRGGGGAGMNKGGYVYRAAKGIFLHKAGLGKIVKGAAKKVGGAVKKVNVFGEVKDALTPGEKKKRPRGYAHGSASIPGPAIILVGEGKNDEGIAAGTHEYIFAPPGTVVAPGVQGEEPTLDAAVAAITRQMKKGKPKRANKGLTATKAKLMLDEGTAQGHALTPAQKRFFGFIAGGGTPTRAQAGVTTRSLFDIAAVPGLAQIRKGSLYDPLGGGSPALRALFPSGVPNLQEYARQSPTQKALTAAAVSSQGVDPAEIEEFQQRGFEGFNPRVRQGESARLLFR